MFNFFKNSLYTRLLFAFLSIGFLPFICFFIYTLVLSDTKIVQKLIVDQHHQVTVMSRLINTHLHSLKKEVSFLARLDVMDDILADDIDKRISRLLIQKKKDYNLSLNFIVINNASKILASSNKDSLLKEYDFFDELVLKKGHFFIKKQLYIYSKVFASFNENQLLGFLILEYDVNNLQEYLLHSKDIYAYLYEKNSSFFVGDKNTLTINIHKDKGSINAKDFLITYQKMDDVLKNWYIVYVVKKDLALEFFYSFVRFMLYLSPFILILIAYISLKFSKHIVRPIKELTQLTDEIVYSKDYSRFLDMASSDEIGRLANSFNTLLNTTDKTLFASKAKSSFISNMSHELKTPLNAIIGFSQYLISYEKLTDEQLDIVSNIEKSSLYLLEMIHGILDIAKIESGKMDVYIQEKDCLVLVQECFDMLEPLAQDKELSFILDYNKTSSFLYNTDEKIFKQIIINIMSNAIKFTNKGSVRIKMTRSKNALHIHIIDTGIGINKEQLPKLFKEFSRIKSGLSSKQEGTGLGLSLSKKLAVLLGGDISLLSEGENKGVEVIFTLGKNR